jgi:hypothetical protein
MNLAIAGPNEGPGNGLGDGGHRLHEWAMTGGDVDLEGRAVSPTCITWRGAERSDLSAITHLFAGVPVSGLETSVDWYTRFFGRPADSRVGDEVLWEIDEHAWLFIEPNAAQAGAGRIALAVAGLDALLERLAGQDASP